MLKTGEKLTDEKLTKEQFFEELASHGRGVLLLDYDGTLAPFRRDRLKAAPYTGVAQLLREIMEAGRTRLVLITGRTAKEVVPLLGIHPHPEMWGSHGLQRLRSDGTYEMPSVERPVLNALLEAERRLRENNLRQFAEFKPGSIAVHWRGHSPWVAEEIRSRVLPGWSAIAERGSLELMEFDGGLELRMCGRTKGDAVRTILAEIDDRTPVAYLGDDQTDEDAYRALDQRGLSVLVRPQWRESAADLWIRPPHELLEFLALWLEAGRGAP